MFIGIAGNIGSGKTTLTKLLTDSFGWKAHYESVDNNPYLADFYNDMQRWSFNLQVYFLTQRFQSIQRLHWTQETVVQDRTIYEDAYIFAQNLFHMGLLDERDHTAYIELFKIMNSFITPPDLLIYLRASVPTLIKLIQKRNREYELSISSEYLMQLNQRYDDWIDSYKGELLIIDVDDLNIVDNSEDTAKVLDIIKRAVENLKK
ncbi:MAG: deoxynucleoside kinase [Bacteroidales bacterium]|nr:deoxynucleoside kinase [Bacteroidales bacterium]